MQSANFSRLIIIFPVLSVLIWSVNIVVTRLAVGAIAPLSISFYRWFFAFLILTPFLLPRVWRERKVIAPYIPKLAVLGLFGMVMYQGLAYVAAQTTTATNMGIINALIPLLTVMVAAVLLKEKPTGFALWGGLLSLVGLSILLGKGNPAHLLEGEIHLGDGLMLLAVLGYACYGVLVRLWRLPLNTWSSVYLQIFFGMLIQLPMAAWGGFSPLNSANINIVLYAAIFPSLLAPWLWIKAIEQLGPNRTSIFMNILPLLTAMIAVVWLNEQWHSYHTLGGLLTLAGVILAQQKPRALPA